MTVEAACREALDQGAIPPPSSSTSSREAVIPCHHRHRRTGGRQRDILAQEDHAVGEERQHMRPGRNFGTDRPPVHLDHIAPTAPEPEGVPGERALLQHRRGVRGQGCEPLPHVRHTGRQPDPSVGCAKASGSSLPPMRIRCPQARSRYVHRVQKLPLEPSPLPRSPLARGAQHRSGRHRQTGDRGTRQ